MKKLIVLSAMILALPFSMMAQDDDMYFVPKKKSNVKAATETYYSGSNRDADEYNRRGKFAGSSVVPMDSASMALHGLSPDSIYVDSLFAERLLKEYNEEENYRFSRQLDRWYGCYDPWFYNHSFYWGPYAHGWYNPWYGPGWYDPFYDPWFDPWFYPYGPGWYGPGWYGPGWAWNHWYGPGWYGPGWYGPYGPGWGGGIIIAGGGSRYNKYGIAGTANHGAVHGAGYGGSRTGTAGHGTFSGARRATTAAANSSSNTGVRRSASTNRTFNNTTNNSSSNYTPARTSSSSSSSFSGSRSSGGGSFSGGGGSHSSSGGGGGGGGHFGGGRR